MGDGGWVGVAAMLVTGLFALFNRRDTLRHDDKLTALKTQNTQQAKQITRLKRRQKRCDNDHAATREKLERCEEQHRSTEVRLEQIETALAQKKDATGEKKPLT